MIALYADSDVERLAQGYRVPEFRSFERVAMRKLRQLQAASTLQDLRVPPDNRLEALRGNRAGQYSLRINDQFRICFTWRGDSAYGVEIVDYH